MANNTRFFTKAITTPRTINGDKNVTEVSIMAASGTCTIEGDYNFGDEEPGPITLAEGQSITLPGANAASPIDGVVITPTGTTNVLMKF